MMLILILPWFPIVLSAAVGARLVGPARANWLGITCALFWVVIVEMTTGVPFWSDSAMAAALLAGSAAIFGMAAWSGRVESPGVDRSEAGARAGAASNDAGDTGATAGDDDARPALHSVVAGAIAQFDDWLEANRFSADAWATFDEFIRNLLYTACGATHVHPYRVLSEGDGMLPLRQIERIDREDLSSARKGILGHVATTGRSFHADDEAQGELVMALAAHSADRPAWCFAVRRGARTIGVISVGRFGSVRPPRPWLDVLEVLIAQFWTTLSEVCRGRVATMTDAASGFLTRSAFLDEACRVAEQCYVHGEPVAVTVIAVEGLRTLVDQGRWDLANDVVYEVCRTLKDRVRPDDVLGRFDDARFLIMLRRVDSELAALIATQLIERLARLPVIDRVPVGRVGVRAGVSGSGTRTPSVTDLVAAAVRLCHDARTRNESVASDVQLAEHEPIKRPGDMPVIPVRSGGGMTPPERSCGHTVEPQITKSQPDDGLGANVR